MVVKSATKKKLMDLGIEEEYAHKLADDRKWDDVKGLSQDKSLRYVESTPELLRESTMLWPAP